MKIYAKCNLSLNVLGLRPDGYHELDMVVCSVSLFDRVRAEARRDDNFICVMDGRTVRENAALAAAALFQASANRSGAARCPGANLFIDKGIPFRAGLGGSSADAAGTLLLLDELFPGRADPRALAAGAGSDTTYMLGGGFARLRGRGEIVEPFSCGAKLYFVFLMAEGGVSTPDAFRVADGKRAESSDNDALVAALAAGDLLRAAERFGNGLLPAARLLNPGVAEVERKLRALRPLAVNMTGSGSGLYALFGSRAEAEAARAELEDSRAVVLESV